ncbi:MAG: PKD domain-containing protein, partial [Flavobacteriales bacterium]|nr:PKD domain-containing protein [Flavobacteriales bacterium]
MRNQINLAALLAAFVLTATTLQAQLVINNTVDAVDGVQNVLLGDGVTVSNITFSGVNQQVAEFTCTDCNLGIASGLIMGSGNVDIAPGPNNSGSATGAPSSGYGVGDPDLTTLTGSTSLNGACVIEFDFVPTGDSVAFDYVFASEEYSEYLGYGDTFGFFLSGPGISGPYSNSAQNIALIPGTSLAVSVPNVNNGPNNTGPCNNCSYFVWNGTGFTSPYNSDDYYIQYDGFTTVLTATAEVQCGETYHIKLAIADMFDDSWDCAVFLAAGSFQSNQVEVAYTPPAISPDASSLYEGCDVAWVSFTRPAGQAGQAADYAVNVTGTATMDLDYTGIPDTLSYVVGQTTISIPIIALEDGLTEGPETITIEVIGTTVCTTSEGVSYTFSIVDVLPVTVTLSDEVINCGESVTLTPVITGGFGYYDIFWGTGETTPSITVSPDDVTTYTYIVTDTCGVDPVNGSTVVSFPAYPPLIVDIGPDQEFTCLEDITVNSTVGGGYGAYTYSWDVNNDTGVSTTTSLVYNTSDEGDVTLTVTDECGTVSTDVMNYTFPPVPVLVNVGPDLDVTCLDVTNLSGVVSGGIGAYTYSWTLNGLEQTETLTYDVQVDEESEIGLIVEDECGNVGSDFLIMDVPPVPVNLELGGDFDVTCIDVSTLVPDVSGGVGAYYYEWSTQYAIVGVDPTLDFQTAESETVSLVVTDECGNEASDFITLTVPLVFMSADAGPDLTTTCIETNTLSV